MSLLCWALGLAALDELTGAEDDCETARRETGALRRANEMNERRINQLEDELRELKRERGEWRGRYS